MQSLLFWQQEHEGSVRKAVEVLPSPREEGQATPVAIPKYRIPHGAQDIATAFVTSLRRSSCRWSLRNGRRAQVPQRPRIGLKWRPGVARRCYPDSGCQPPLLWSGSRDPVTGNATAGRGREVPGGPGRSQPHLRRAPEGASGPRRRSAPPPAPIGCGRALLCIFRSPAPAPLQWGRGGGCLISICTSAERRAAAAAARSHRAPGRAGGRRGQPRRRQSQGPGCSAACSSLGTATRRQRRGRAGHGRPRAVPAGLR